MRVCGSGVSCGASIKRCMSIKIEREQLPKAAKKKRKGGGGALHQSPQTERQEGHTAVSPRGTIVHETRGEHQKHRQHYVRTHTKYAKQVKRQPAGRTDESARRGRGRKRRRRRVHKPDGAKTLLPLERRCPELVCVL